jgi:LmbE family N-acetylglucosaminyl deacetylase
VKVLVVVAHPDDEVQGCGGTISRMARRGDKVRVLALADGVRSRHGTSTHPVGDDLDCTMCAAQAEAREREAHAAAAVLGCEIQFARFLDQRLDVVPQVDLIRYVELALLAHRPELVLLHDSGDPNQDHRAACAATVTACRIGFAPFVRGLWTFTTGPQPRFVPNVWVQIMGLDLENKLAALEAYASEKLDPQYELIATAAAGADMGCERAESFRSLRHWMP